MKTVVSSATKTIVISPQDPFVIIGERINPTNRKKLAEELRRFDFTRVKSNRRSSSASFLRLVGLMRSPMMTNGSCGLMTMVFVAEETTVFMPFAHAGG